MNKGHEKARFTEMKSEEQSTSNIYFSYNTNMQHFPIVFAAEKKTDGFNPLPHISSEYEHMLCAFIKIFYVYLSD